MHTYTDACMHTYDKYIHTYIHTHIHTYTHTQIRTYIHTLLYILVIALDTLYKHQLHFVHVHNTVVSAVTQDTCSTYLTVIAYAMYAMANSIYVL